MTNEERNLAVLESVLFVSHPYHIKYGTLYQMYRSDADEQKSIQMRQYTCDWLRSLDSIM